MADKKVSELEAADGPPRREKKRSDGFCCGCKITFPRVAWLIMTVMVLSGFAYHISLQMMKYLSYPVRQNIIARSDSTVFPDVTVCPSTYFSDLRHKLLSVFPPDPAWKDKTINFIFQKNLAFLWNTILFNKTSGMNFEESHYYMKHAKFTYLAQFASSQVAPTFGDNLLECEYAGERCDLSRVRPFFHPRYGLCYTFSPSNETLVDSSKNFGLHMTLSFSDSKVLDVEMASRDMVSGSTVFFHRRNSFPDMEYPRQAISYGNMLAADFTYSFIQKLNTPIVPCEAEEEFELCRIEPNNRRACRKYKETSWTREFVQRQFELNRQCSCVSEEWPIPVTLKNQKSCHYMPDLAFIHKGFRVYDNQSIVLQHLNGRDWIPLTHVVDLDSVKKRYTCYERVRDELVKTSVEKRTCTVDKYDLKMDYTTHWINRDSLYVPPKVTRDHLGQHLKDSIEMSQPQRKELNVSSIFYDIEIFEDNKTTNLLQSSAYTPSSIYLGYLTLSSRLYVFSSESGSYVKREDYIYDAMFFLADAGGVLGLWVGFSLLSILDIIEIAIVRWRRKKAAKKQV